MKNSIPTYTTSNTSSKPTYYTKNKAKRRPNDTVSSTADDSHEETLKLQKSRGKSHFCLIWESICGLFQKPRTVTSCGVQKTQVVAAGSKPHTALPNQETHLLQQLKP